MANEQWGFYIACYIRVQLISEDTWYLYKMIGLFNDLSRPGFEHSTFHKLGERSDQLRHGRNHLKAVGFL